MIKVLTYTDHIDALKKSQHSITKEAHYHPTIMIYDAAFDSPFLCLPFLCLPSLRASLLPKNLYVKATTMLPSWIYAREHADSALKWYFQYSHALAYTYEYYTSFTIVNDPHDKLLSGIKIQTFLLLFFKT